ncbi:MAG: hypothetical protein QM638_02000 [Nocardioides sp.]|uniref:hypothetical protein n=1 Tax=Nocardioides sp. TaxID=35761 RepID=UPI0039E58CCA
MAAKHDEDDEAMLTVGMVIEAFRRLPMPEAPLKIQPPDGRTLVNFDTIFYTTRRPFARSVTLLGHHITFHIRPARYRWVFGDGRTLTTTKAGDPYSTQAHLPRDITHRYLTKDTFHPHVDVSYTATYTVDGTGGRRIDGTVTIPGTPQRLVSLTATPHLDG